MSAAITDAADLADRLAKARADNRHLRQRLDTFARFVDIAERGGATVIRIEDIRRGLKIGARR